ncbi:MAG TPA: flagellar hook-associated protein FlgK [Nocardioidaceae bacterium]|nr:flagellar hook-associated protein FlgK [Nocardioidaceae bacterium]
MSGTFSSLSGALSALRYNRVAMDVASSNVANANTEGYTRRVAIAQAVGAPAAPALWSRWNGSAGGVEVGGIERMVDPLLDARSRTEHGSLSYLSTRASSLVRLETTLGEPGDNGVAAALSAFKQGWGDVANNPADEAARSQLLGRAETLRASISSQARSVATEWADQRTRLDTVAAEINTVAADLAELNRGLRSAHLAGTDAGTLLDQRDQLTLRLAQLTGATVHPNDDTTVDVTVDGIALVTASPDSVNTVQVSGALTMSGASGSPVTLSLGGSPLPPPGATLKGELGASHDLLTRDLPGYQAKLDAFVADLVAQTNAQHQAGADLDGNTNVPFFSGTTAADLAVAVTDPRAVAAATPGQGTLDASNADALFAMDLGAKTYRSLVTEFGVTVSSARRVADNQTVLTAQVDASRESLAGVNIDEEMVNLLAAQRAYEGAARVITAIDSVLDTLINRTGLMR